MGLTWSFQPPAGTTFVYLRTTSRFVYVPFGWPIVFSGNEPTNRRLNFLCHAAAQAGTALEVIEGVPAFGGQGIHAALDADPPCDGNRLSPLSLPPCNSTGGTIVDDWRLKAGPPYVGECHHQAHLMNLATQLVGAGAGNDYCTYPSMAGDCDPSSPCGFGETVKTAAEAGITWDIDGDGTIGEELLILRFDFPDETPAGDGTNINAFEGTVEYVALGRYYAVWPSLRADSKCGLLAAIKTMGAIQCWDRLDTAAWECVRDPATGQLKREEFPVCGPGCP
jgi:hypothetical protein